MECHCPGLCGAPLGLPSESVPVPQVLSSAWSLNFTKWESSTEGVTEPLHSHPSFPSASRPEPPQARILPHASPSQDHPPGVVHRLSREPSKAPQRSPPGRGPQRGDTGPGASAAFPGPVRPQAHPLYLAFRLGLLPLQLGLEETVGTRAS